MISTQVEKKTFVSIADSFREEGVEMGIEKSRMEIARNLLADGLDPASVAKNTGLDLETIEKIKATLH